LAYNLLYQPKLVLAVYLIGSFLFMLVMHHGNPYHDPIVNRLWSCIAVIHFWSVLMLVSAFNLEEGFLNGWLIIWISGLPLLVLVVCR
jgi:hypothetical protein